MKRRKFITAIGSISATSTLSTRNFSPYIPNLRKGYKDLFSLDPSIKYFNCATFGPSPSAVLESMRVASSKVNANGEYGNSEDCRRRTAEFIGAEKSEISITKNTTEGINKIAWAIPLNEGDEIILTRQEHVGNALPWIHIARKKNLTLRFFDPLPNQNQVIEQIEKLITKKTKVFALPHITCTTGQILPIKRISILAQERNIFTAIDGAHGPGMMPIDVKNLNVDAYASCFHKWVLGPAGMGFFYLNKKWISEFEPVFVGAHSDKGWKINDAGVQFNGFVEDAHRFHYGTESYAQAQASISAITFHEKIGKDEVWRHIKDLGDKLYVSLEEIKNIEVLTPYESASRGGIITFRLRSKDTRRLYDHLRKSKIRPRYVPESDVHGIRVSMHVYNSEDDLDQLCQEIIKYIN